MGPIKIFPLCKTCGGVMRQSKALLDTIVVPPDFAGDTAEILDPRDVHRRPDLVGRTMSAGGPGLMVDCFKCENCGRSITK